MRIVAAVEPDVVQPVTLTRVSHTSPGAAKCTTTRVDGKCSPVRVMSSLPPTLPEVGLTDCRIKSRKANVTYRLRKAPPLKEVDIVAGAPIQGQSGVRMVAEVGLVNVHPEVTSMGVVKQAPPGAVKRTVTNEGGKKRPLRVMSSLPETMPEAGLRAWTIMSRKVKETAPVNEPPLNETDIEAIAPAQDHRGVRMVAWVEFDAFQPVVTSMGVVKHAPLGAVKRTTTKDVGKYSPVKVMSSSPATPPELGLTAWTSNAANV